MKSILKFILVILILNFSVLKAEIVNNAIIKGNKRISEETILVYGEIKLQKDYSEADINNIIKNLYSTNFFEDVQIKLVENNLIIDLKEYPVLNQLVIIGEKSNKFKDEIKKSIKLKEKDLSLKHFSPKILIT